MITQYTGDAYRGARGAMGKYYSAVNRGEDLQNKIRQIREKQKEDDERRKARLLLWGQLMKLGGFVGERLEKQQNINRGMVKMGIGKEYNLGAVQSLFKIPKSGEEIGDRGVTYGQAEMAGSKALPPELLDDLLDTFVIER